MLTPGRSIKESKSTRKQSQFSEFDDREEPRCVRAIF